MLVKGNTSSDRNEVYDKLRYVAQIINQLPISAADRPWPSLLASWRHLLVASLASSAASAAQLRYGTLTP